MAHRLSYRFAALAVAFLMMNGPLRGQDQADGNGTFPGWDLGGRRDANIAGFFAFQTKTFPAKLVLILALDAGSSDPGYFFAEDLTVRFHIDNHSAVTFSDGNPATTVDDWMMRFGGTVTAPDKITADIVFVVTFKPTADGRTAPELRIGGLEGKFKHDITQDIRMFPEFNESPVRVAGNAWVVLEVPLDLVVTPDDPARPFDDTLLLWATSNVPEVPGWISDHIGMPNTSSLHGNLVVNRLRPRDQPEYITEFPRDLFVEPLPGNPVSLAPYADVLILDSRRSEYPFPPVVAPQFNPYNPTRFPNGHPVFPHFRLDPFVFPYIASD